MSRTTWAQASAEMVLECRILRTRGVDHIDRAIGQLRRREGDMCFCDDAPHMCRVLVESVQRTTGLAPRAPTIRRYSGTWCVSVPWPGEHGGFALLLGVDA